MAQRHVVDVGRSPASWIETARPSAGSSLRSGVRHKIVFDAVRRRFSHASATAAGIGRTRPQIAQAIDAQTRFGLNIAPAAVGIGLDLGNARGKGRVEQDQQVTDRQELHPPQRLQIVLVLVVALDRQARDARFFELFQPGDGLVERERVDAALLEQVTRQRHEVHAFVDGNLNDSVERLGEIVEAIA